MIALAQPYSSSCKGIYFSIVTSPCSAGPVNSLIQAGLKLPLKPIKARLPVTKTAQRYQTRQAHPNTTPDRLGRLRSLSSYYSGHRPSHSFTWISQGNNDVPFPFSTFSIKHSESEFENTATGKLRNLLSQTERVPGPRAGER